MIFTVKENLQHWGELLKLVGYIVLLAHFLAILFHVIFYIKIFFLYSNNRELRNLKFIF